MVVPYTYLFPHLLVLPIIASGSDSHFSLTKTFSVQVFFFLEENNVTIQGQASASLHTLS